MTERSQAHFENKEPFLEKFLRNRRFRKILPHIPNDSKILDIGCGFNGEILKNIESKIESAVGIDISVNENANSQKIKLLRHDLDLKLPLPDEEFDAVISLANLEHLENPLDNLREVFRVLKPKGILLLTVPSFRAKPVLNFLSFRLNLISHAEIRDHRNYFDKKILLNWCQEIGFSPAEHKYFQFGMNNFLKAEK
jgi:SAM-dependent methyltransferase